MEFVKTRDAQKEFFTTEYTEFHGGKDDFRIKTPWYSVVNSYFLDSPSKTAAYFL